MKFDFGDWAYENAGWCIVIFFGFLFVLFTMLFSGEAKLNDQCAKEYNEGKLSYRCAKHMQYVPQEMVPIIIPTR